MDVIYPDVKNEVIRDHDLLLMYTVKINEQLHQSSSDMKHIIQG